MAWAWAAFWADKEGSQRAQGAEPLRMCSEGWMAFSLTS